ncbi:MAG: hypothetical protein QM756_38555 [Polyangiaceae bacterium]
MVLACSCGSTERSPEAASGGANAGGRGQAGGASTGGARTGQAGEAGTGAEGNTEAGAGGVTAAGGKDAGASGGSEITSGGATTSLGGAPATGGEAGSPIGAGGADSAVGGEGGAEASGGSAGSAPVLDCDDRNVCTRDFALSGACQHEAVPDGAACDDHDFCTLGDRCEKAKCASGTTQTGAGELLGRLPAFGSGTSISFGDDRLLFFDRIEYADGHLTLARVENQSVKRLSSLDVSNTPWTPVFAAWENLVALSDGSSSVTLNGPPRGLRLFSVERGTLRERGKVDLPGAVGPAIATLAGGGKRAFMCANYSFLFSPVQGTVHWFDVSNPDAPSLVASAELELGTACGSLATSALGERVYVNTVSGVRWADLSKWSGGTSFEFEPNLVVAENSGLSLRNGRLLARSVDTVRVFDEATLTQQSSFSAAGARGATLTGDYVFSFGQSADNHELYVALQDLQGALLEQRTIATFPYTVNFSGVRAVAGARVGVSPFGGRLWGLGANGFTPIEQHEMARPEQLRADGAGVHARSRTHWNRLDVSDPANPRWAAGGPHGSTDFGMRLDGASEPRTLVGDSAPDFLQNVRLANVQVGYGHGSETLIERVSTDAEEHPQHLGSVSLPGGNAKLASIGDSIYRVQSLSPNVRFERFRLADLEARVTTPSFQITLPTTDTAYPILFDVDPDAARAVVAYGFRDPDSGPMAKLSVLDLSGAEPRLIDDVQTQQAAHDVLLRGDQLVYHTIDSLIFRRVGGGETRRQAFEEYGVEALLGFDGKVVYFSESEHLRAVSTTSDALLIDQPVHGTLTSLVETPTALVASSPREVLTLAPACR